MELANGSEPDGIKYRVHLEAPQWVVTVTHPNGRVLSERFNWAWEPRAGPDVADVSRAEQIMDRLIDKSRKQETAPSAE